MSTVDVMCVGAHPDDVEIGMGATIAKMARQGRRVAIVDLTNGEPTPAGSPEIRARESACAAEALGAVERRTLSMPNRYLFDSREAREELAEVIRELRPSTLFGPYPDDAHPDHLAAASIVTGARFYAKFTKTAMKGEPHYPERLYRYMAVHLRLAVQPDFIVRLGEQDLAAKLSALGCYESQFAANPANRGIVESMELSARSWGALARCETGEPFFAVEPISVDSPFGLL